jgi:colanic acid biosynthesis glycosyl transferase WcaI
MAEWFKLKGHQIRVVTALPYYPAWKVFEGYPSWRYRRERIAGVDVYRCPLWVPSSPRGFTRIVHLSSFALSSFPITVKQAFWRPQIVITIAPPIFIYPTAHVTAVLSGAKLWLHIQDFEVDAAFDLGLLSSNYIRSLAQVVEHFLFKGADRVSTISERMIERLLAKGISHNKVVLFPNWVDTTFIRPSLEHNIYREELGFSVEDIVCLYSGNMGEKQGLEIILSTARQLASNSKIKFVLCGDGVALRRLRRESAILRNVFWLPLQPYERLNDLLNMADIHLLPQRSDVADLVMPSKLLSMLASGKPVLATTHPGTQIADIVKYAGIVVSPENVSEFSTELFRLANEPEMRFEYGSAARNYALRYFEKEVVLSQFETELLSCLE